MKKVKQSTFNPKALADLTKISLKDLGLSLDEHFYNYENILHKHFCNVSSLEFLKVLSAFYSSLSDIEQKIFLFEYLEEGRHFKYWYESYCTRKSFLKTKRELFKKTGEIFNEI